MDVEPLSALKLFNEKAEKLGKLSFTRSALHVGIGVTLTIASTPEASKVKVVRAAKKGPDEEAVDAFVLTFRFFIQDNEKSSFRNMAKIYDGLPASLLRERDLFAHRREMFNEYLDSKSALKVERKDVTHRETMDVFMWGGLSHANKDKKKVFDTWMSNQVMAPFLQTEFRFILRAAFIFIMDVRDLNEQVLKELEALH